MIYLWLLLYFIYVYFFYFLLDFNSLVGSISLFLLSCLYDIYWIKCYWCRTFWHSSCNKWDHPWFLCFVIFSIVEKLKYCFINTHWNHTIETQEKWNWITSKESFVTLFCDHFTNSFSCQLISWNMFWSLVQMEHSSCFEHPNRIGH